MKQEISKEKTEECPTQCSICGNFYSDGSCLMSIGKYGLLRMCLDCFNNCHNKTKDERKLICDEIGKEKINKRNCNFSEIKIKNKNDN